MYSKRQNEIIRYLSEVKFSKIEELAVRFHVSVETVRRDLLELEKESAVKRVRGGAVYNSLRAQEMEYEKRMESSSAEKRAIAKLAVEYINDGDAIVMNNGTATLEMARCLLESGKHVIVVTNSPDIAMILNERQIPTPAVHAKINLTRKGPYSGKWSSERISFMLQNEVYIGNMVQGRSQKISYKSEKCRKIPREDWIVVENTHEPIIDRGTFEKVAMLIASRNLTRSRTYEYLLKGLIFCHECGYPLGVINRRLAGNREMLYFICRTYQRFTKYETCTCHCVRVDDVTNAVLEQIHRVCRQYSEQLNLEQITDKAQKMLREEKRRQGKDIAGAKARLAEIQSKIDKSYEDRLSGIVDEDVFQRVYQKLKDEQTTLRKKLQKLERSDHEIELDKAKVKALVERFLNAEEYSRELLVSLIERIELTKEKEILIYFKFKELDVASRL